MPAGLQNFSKLPEETRMLSRGSSKIFLSPRNFLSSMTLKNLAKSRDPKRVKFEVQRVSLNKNGSCTVVWEF